MKIKLNLIYHIKAHKYYNNQADYGIQYSSYETMHNISIETAQKILKDFENDENIDEMIFRRITK